MPGFVDVSGMTYEVVRRMGHADDYDEETNRNSYRRGSFRQPAPARTNTVLQIGHSVSDVWAAACAAHRVNDGYFKEHLYLWDEASNKTKLTKTRNRDVMMEFLQNPDRLLTEDVELGEQCRKYLDQDLTFRAIKGTLTDFDKSIKAVLAVKERFYTVSNRYELAVAACLPNSYLRSVARSNAQDRLVGCRAVDAEVGAKVQFDVEIVESTYSHKFGLFWVKAVTTDNCAVSFSAKQKYDAGVCFTIQGKVKAQRDNLTQLNYVKVL